MTWWVGYMVVGSAPWFHENWHAARRDPIL